MQLLPLRLPSSGKLSPQLGKRPKASEVDNKYFLLANTLLLSLTLASNGGAIHMLFCSLIFCCCYFAFSHVSGHRELFFFFLKTSLVVQWLRIHLLLQETQV